MNSVLMFGVLLAPAAAKFQQVLPDCSTIVRAKEGYFSSVEIV
jgi:hypothetical protein